MEEPIPLITTGDDGTGLVVNPKAKEILRQITKPMVIVSVVGMYRTGKSFLLNCLMKKNNGFPLGSTVEAKTKGIWIWTGDFPNDPNKAMVLLDTEGLHDPEKGSRTHDTEIFTLAVLFSSIMIYNCKGSIDANSLDVLHVASELTSNISMKADKDDDEEEFGDEFANFFPLLVWAVRDQHLELSVDGKDITANEYLENCLALKRGRSKAAISSNALKETIRAFFKRRHCFLFPLPTAMENLKNLDNLGIEELDPKFIKAGNDFTEFVFQNGLCKMVNGKEVTGSMFTTLVEQYVEATGFINMESTYDYLIETENKRATEQAVLHYQTQMKSIVFPVTLDTLNKANTKAQSEASEIFLKTAVNNDKNVQYFRELNQQLEQIYQAHFEKNHVSSKEKCEKILADLYMKIEKEVDAGKFTQPGGHAAFRNLIVNLEESYNAVPDSEKGPGGQIALFTFKARQVEPTLSTLLQTDNALSKEQKNQEQLKKEIEEKENMTLILDEKCDELKKQQSDTKESFESNLKKQKDEFAKQHEQQMENLQENLKLRMEEKERLMQEGFEEKANLIKEELQEAKEDIAKKERDRNEMEEKLKKEMDEKIKQMEEEQRERIGVIQQLQAHVLAGKSGMFTEVFRKMGGGFHACANDKIDDWTKEEFADMFSSVGKLFDRVTTPNITFSLGQGPKK